MQCQQSGNVTELSMQCQQSGDVTECYQCSVNKVEMLQRVTNEHIIYCSSLYKWNYGAYWLLP